MSADTILAIEAARHRQLEQELKQAQARIAALEAENAKLRDTIWRVQRSMMRRNDVEELDAPEVLCAALGHFFMCQSMLESGAECDCGGAGGGQ